MNKQQFASWLIRKGEVNVLTKVKLIKHKYIIQLTGYLRASNNFRTAKINTEEPTGHRNYHWDPLNIPQFFSRAWKRQEGIAHHAPQSPQLFIIRIIEFYRVRVQINLSSVRSTLLLGLLMPEIPEFTMKSKCIRHFIHHLA